MGRIVSYRGLLADGGIDTIPLHTNNGKTGYKIVKFQVMPNEPGTGGAAENIVQINKVLPTAVKTTVDFSDLTLLGVAIWIGNKNPAANVPSPYDSVVFDNEVFNQDIYVSQIDTDGSESVNYYIELEQVPLTEDQALVAIVKNLRNEQ
jgi:hypothetical protein